MPALYDDYANDAQKYKAMYGPLVLVVYEVGHFYEWTTATRRKKMKKIEPLCSLQWLSQFLSGLATCVGMHGPGDQPRRLLFTWPSRGVSAPAGSAGHARALVVLPHLLPPSSCFQLSWVRPRVPLLPPVLSSLLLATWGFSSSCSMAVSSGAAAAGPGQDPTSAHAAHLNLPPSASPPSADHPCGSAL